MPHHQYQKILQSRLAGASVGVEQSDLYMINQVL